MLREAFYKEPPGPPPKPDWVWHEETRRWRNPANWEDSDPQRTMMSVFGDRGIIHITDVQQQANEAVDTFVPEEAPSYVNARENFAVLDYIGHVYRKVNTELRRQSRWQSTLSSSVKSIVEKMQEVMKPLEEEQVLYRGVGQLPQKDIEDINVGDEFTFDSFASCSRSAMVALDFAGMSGATQTVLELETTPITQGITLSNKDTYSAEDETILDVGQRVLVKEVKDIFVGIGADKGRMHEFPETHKPVTIIRGIVVPEVG